MVLDLLRDHELDQPGLVTAVKQVIDYVTTLSTEPEEEGKPWWK